MLKIFQSRFRIKNISFQFSESPPSPGPGTFQLTTTANTRPPHPKKFNGISKTMPPASIPEDLDVRGKFISKAFTQEGLSEMTFVTYPYSDFADLTFVLNA